MGRADQNCLAIGRETIISKRIRFLPTLHIDIDEGITTVGGMNCRDHPTIPIVGHMAPEICRYMEYDGLRLRWTPIRISRRLCGNLGGPRSTESNTEHYELACDALVKRHNMSVLN